MSETLAWLWGFRGASFVAAALVVLLAAWLRSRAYAVFRGVSLTIHILIAGTIWPETAQAAPVFLGLHVTVFVQAVMLIRPSLRPAPYRWLIHWPEAVFRAGTFLALPWAIALGLGFAPAGLWIPYLLALLGLMQTLSRRRLEVHRLTVGRVQSASRVERAREATSLRTERPLRLVQLTDTHLGPFMSVARLRAICERASAAQPDLVLLTGDFLTMESQADPDALAEALRPLAALSGRVFACFGNHDHEAPQTVRSALDEIGARLLVDEAAVAHTAAGPVQVVGADFRYRHRAEHLTKLCQKVPPEPNALRLLLLHDPGAFRHVPAGEADLVLSGHTHGGQVGLVTFGLPYTVLGLVGATPDHGLWAHGTSRLYVHRGTGHYGFPLRLGVPHEESVLEVEYLRAD